MVTIKNPVSHPQHTWARVWAFRVILDQPTMPPSNTETDMSMSSGWAYRNEYATKPPVKPPIPLRCALIFHFRLQMAIDAIDTEDAYKAPV